MKTPCLSDIVARPRHIVPVLLLCAAGPARAFCFAEAGARYHIDPLLLESIAIHETGMQPDRVGHNRDRAGHITSSDYGLMQINTTHVPELTAAGLIHTRRELLTRPCLNAQAGAWILARTFHACGVNWTCLGAYNAGFRKTRKAQARRLWYARQIYAIYSRLKAGRTAG